MLRLFKPKINKGYILLYVLLTGIICIMLITFGYRLQFERTKNENSTLKHFSTQSIEQKNREYLFTEFAKYININSITMSTDSINSYLSSRAISFKIIFEDSNLTYDSVKKFLIAEYQYPFNSYQKIYEYYSVSVHEGKLNFTIENSKIE